MQLGSNPPGVTYLREFRISLFCIHLIPKLVAQKPADQGQAPGPTALLLLIHLAVVPDLVPQSAATFTISSSVPHTEQSKAPQLPAEQHTEHTAWVLEREVGTRDRNNAELLQIMVLEQTV